jgi:hypothetical protein
MSYKIKYKTITIHEIVSPDNLYACFDVDVEVKLGIQEPFKGSAWNCDSDADYNGYTELLESRVIDWQVEGDDGTDLTDHYANELPEWVEEMALEQAGKLI